MTTTVEPRGQHETGQAPLLVHLIFHPRSTRARQLAEAMHIELNADSVVPGLRIPTSFPEEMSDAVAPAMVDLDQSQRGFVVVLADEEMHVADDWSRLVGDIWEATFRSGDRHRCVPVQLAGHAWPLDPRLSRVNFVRAYGLSDSDTGELVARRLVIELCRFLNRIPAGDSGEPSAAPTRIFLSHTKLDIDAEPQVVRQLMTKLGPDQQNKTWFDSGDITAGGRFSDAIEAGIADSSLLCVLTDNYAGREWCRREVLLAKRLGRPILVVDALRSHETRSFPYLGNVPVVRWDNNPQLLIDRLLKESLRVRHAELLLSGQTMTGDLLFTRPPELLTVAALDDKTLPVLYPDPPLGMEESLALSWLGVRATTPLGKLAERVQLAGRRIALSMSPSNDVHRWGFSQLHLRQAMLEVSRYLLISGATLVYGGHLGDEGYTVALAELVRSHNQLDGVPPVQRLQNYLAWPLVADTKTRSKYKEVAQIIPVPRPADVDESLHPDFAAVPQSPFDGETSALHRYAFARGMTDMRLLLAQDETIAARIVLGGLTGPSIGRGGASTWYSSRMPGVLEEVLLAAQAAQPVFLIGAFGGVAALVMDILDERPRADLTWEFHRSAPHATEMRQIYSERGEKWIDYADVAAELRDIGLARLNPLLTPQQHRELFASRDTGRIIELVLSGLSNLD